MQIRSTLLFFGFFTVEHIFNNDYETRTEKLTSTRWRWSPRAGKLSEEPVKLRISKLWNWREKFERKCKKRAVVFETSKREFSITPFLFFKNSIAEANNFASKFWKCALHWSHGSHESTHFFSLFYFQFNFNRRSDIMRPRNRPKTSAELQSGWYAHYQLQLSR